MALSHLVEALRLWIPPKETDEFSRENYRYVVIDGLDSDELRSSAFPGNLFSFSMKFESPQGRIYQAVHFLRHYLHGPHIHLYSLLNLSQSDWNHVQETIESLVNADNGRYDASSSRSGLGNTTQRRIHLPRDITPQKLAVYLEGYEQKFGKVATRALFDGVPKSAFEYPILAAIAKDRLHIIE